MAAEWRMRNKRFSMPLAVVSATLLVTAGCTMEPHYRRPVAPVPAAWPAVAPVPAGSANAADVGWQSFFSDPRLKQLIALALANNRDLRVSVARIDEARGQHRIQRADLLPNIGASGAATRQKGLNPAGGAGGGSAPGAIDVYQANVGVSAFELDFWGRVRSLNKAARESYLSTVEAERAFRISLIADVASSYLSLLAADEGITLAENTLKSRREGLQLADLRLKAGVTSALDYRQTETLLTQAETELAALRRQRAQTENALGVLVGGPIPADLPPPIALEKQGLDGRIGAGLPSLLLASRPDVLSAEHSLRAANANIGAARAAFFPTINLTGAFGFASLDLENLFDKGSQAWNYGGTLSLPLFDFGRNKANLDVAKARNNIAVATYEKAIQTAFREVADALAARRFLAEQVAAQTRALATQRDLAELAELRYRNGVANYLEVLDAQRNLFSAEQALVQSRSDQQANLVALYVALGGGVNP